MTLILGTTILSIPAWVFWLIVLIVAGIIEVVTVNMVSIWFAVGALVSLLLDIHNLSLVLQIVAFFLVSILCFLIFILLVRPRFSASTEGIVPTNADRIIGQKGVVVKEIKPLENTGQILVMGQLWSAGSQEDKVIAIGTIVEVVEISGVRAIVKLFTENSEHVL
ncbi:MAG TPA: NfeD family protein [Clostridiaceae bacterium]|nr:NfeD family protein [Clostridiaceae bacterium]